MRAVGPLNFLLDCRLCQEISRSEDHHGENQHLPQFATGISIPVVERLSADCPRIIGIKDSSSDFPRFCSLIHKIKALRPDFSILMGTEEILLPSLIMGGDAATIATSGVAPEVVMQLLKPLFPMQSQMPFLLRDLQKNGKNPDFRLTPPEKVWTFQSSRGAVCSMAPAGNLNKTQAPNS